MAKIDRMFSLPETTMNSWKVSQQDLSFNRENLYEYINGGAELFLSYGFQKMINRTYSKPDQPDIIIDIFDMKESRNAFGVFSHSRELIDDSFGQGSQYTAGLMLFWKDKYYISILASPETPESKKEVYQLAEIIDNSIDTTGPIPEIINFLPEENLVKESIRYFYHYIWMNSHYFIADKNILNINKTTEAVLARYKPDKQSMILLTIQYANTANAENAYTNFIREYLPELSGQDAVRIEDNTFTAARLINNLLIIVFNALKEEDALKLIESVHR